MHEEAHDEGGHDEEHGEEEAAPVSIDLHRPRARLENPTRCIFVTVDCRPTMNVNRSTPSAEKSDSAKPM
jgi:hypothetical protein